MAGRLRGRVGKVVFFRRGGQVTQHAMLPFPHLAPPKERRRKSKRRYCAECGKELPRHETGAVHRECYRRIFGRQRPEAS